MTTIVTRLSFTTQHQTCKTKTKTKKHTSPPLQDQDRFFGLRPVLSQERQSQTCKTKTDVFPLDWARGWTVETHKSYSSLTMPN